MPEKYTKYFMIIGDTIETGYFERRRKAVEIWGGNPDKI